MLSGMRSRAMSYDGYQGGVGGSPRFYPSNQPDYRPTTYGVGPGMMGMSNFGMGGFTGYAANPCCAPQPQQVQVYQPPPPQPAVQGNQTAHAFQSNTPASCCEGLVNREVQYQTEWVAVPVQKPVVYETYQKVVEVPTQHLVNVQNIPGPVPDCDRRSAGAAAAGGYGNLFGYSSAYGNYGPGYGPYGYPQTSPGGIVSNIVGRSRALSV